MALGLTAEHLALAESVHGWASRHCPPELVRAVVDGPGPGADLGPALGRQGLLGLHLAEEHGGQGYGISELAVAIEQLGRALVPGAFLPTVLASAIISRAALSCTAPNAAAKLLAGLADGSRPAAVSLAAGMSGTTDPAGQLVIDGSSGPVLGGGLADLVILPVQTSQGEVWAAVDAAGLDRTDLGGVDRTRTVTRLRADQVTVPAGQVLPGLDRADVAALAAVAFAAEACGVADWATATAAEHARLRHQFGRPIGQFQAVKHRCARMLTAAEQAAAATWDAARAWDLPGPGTDPAPIHLAAAVAAVVAVDAAVSCTHECIQVLGGIGYTWEHPAHLYYRRALSLRALLGPSVTWARRVTQLSLAGTRRPLTVDLPAAAEPARERIRAELAAIAGQPAASRARQLADGGWAMPHLPRPWGRGADPLEQLIIDEELKRAGLRRPALLIGAWVVPALVQYGTAAQQDRFLPATLRGEITWCQLFSEPGAGSDLAGLTTRAERVKGDGEAGGGWRLTGQKIWTSLAKEADWAICVARTDPATRRHAGISYFLVDMKSPGVEVRPLREISGDAMFNEVFLD